MKKTICVWMLLTSITASLCAQVKSKSDKTFEVPANIIISRRFFVDLENGNKMQIDLSDIADLERVANIDSLLQIFLQDIAPLQDSLTGPLAARRIDHVTDAQGRKKIRLQQFPPGGASFLVSKGELASLRTAQDTIHLIGIVVNPPKAEQQVSITNPRYYHLIFYLNSLADLSAYMNGVLKTKIKTIQTDVNGKWPLILGGSFHYLEKDKTISAEKRKGFTENSIGDFITGYATINAQNYKHYFVPSFSVGIRLTLTNRERSFKWEPGLLWEPHYLFARDNQNKLRTYRNDFLTFNYAQGGTKGFDARKDFAFSNAFSLSYLIHRTGDYFQKNTFRLGAGKIQLFKTAIEPSLYFNNFFKGVTPAIRIIQSF